LNTLAFYKLRSTLTCHNILSTLAFYKIQSSLNCRNVLSTLAFYEIQSSLTCHKILHTLAFYKIQSTLTCHNILSTLAFYIILNTLTLHKYWAHWSSIKYWTHWPTLNSWRNWPAINLYFINCYTLLILVPKFLQVCFKFQNQCKSTGLNLILVYVTNCAIYYTEFRKLQLSDIFYIHDAGEVTTELF
jgi:hypothetical protein